MDPLKTFCYLCGANETQDSSIINSTTYYTCLSHPQAFRQEVVTNFINQCVTQYWFDFRYREKRYYINYDVNNNLTQVSVVIEGRFYEIEPIITLPLVKITPDNVAQKLPLILTFL